MTPAVQFEQVTIRRDQQAALDAATFVLPTGSLTAVLGPNGAGKSTLLRAINGELRPAGGWVRVLGEVVRIDPVVAEEVVAHVHELMAGVDQDRVLRACGRLDLETLRELLEELKAGAADA